MKGKLKIAALSGTVLFGGGCGLFLWLWAESGAAWAQSAAITCGMFLYHIAIRGAWPFLALRLWPNPDPHRGWFRPRSWERPLYRALKVRRWKARLPTYDSQAFSLERYGPEQVAGHMCQSELVHEGIALLSLLSLLFAIPFGAFPVFLLTGLASAGLDLVFAIAQRFNRPRVLKLLSQRRKN